MTHFDVDFDKSDCLGTTKALSPRSNPPNQNLEFILPFISFHIRFTLNQSSNG
jgi:hypothetical protein